LLIHRCLRKSVRVRLSKHATHVLASDRACRNRRRTMAALWRGATSQRTIFSGARHARRPQRCAGASGNGSSGVVRSAGSTFARLGRYSPGAQAIRPPPALDLRRELVRDHRRGRIICAGGQRVGRGISELRLQLEQMSRRMRALHANRLGRHQRSGMRSGARPRTRGLGLRLRSARQLGRQAALLGRPRPALPLWPNSTEYSVPRRSAKESPRKMAQTSLAPHTGHVSNFCGLRHGPLELLQLLSDQWHARKSGRPIQTGHPVEMVLEPRETASR
jgi:hypothetical protein